MSIWTNDPMSSSPLAVWTIGHSTREFTEFLDVLQAHDISRVIDVRTYPGSRRYPQFNRVEMAAALSEAGIGYTHLPELGGRRRSRADSINAALRNDGCRGYADYMETREFKTGIGTLLEAARRERIAIMCAEALWWRCHRSLVSDYLHVMGVKVLHLRDARNSDEHRMTKAATVVGGRLSYVPDPLLANSARDEMN